MQRGRDSNPRYTFGVYTLSKRAPSTARPPLYNITIIAEQIKRKKINYKTLYYSFFRII